jgi:DNA-binding beta-propeller fold protein YncE
MSWLLIAVSGLFVLPVTAEQLDRPDLIQIFHVGHGPKFLAFDGFNIWVTTSGDDTVTKLLATDGSPQGTFGTGGRYPQFITFDGPNIWVSNLETDSVGKLQASDGTLLGTFQVGNVRKA